MTPVGRHVAEIIVRPFRSLGRIGHEQPLLREIVVRHAGAIVGDDNAVIPKMKVDSVGPGIERVLDQLKDGDLIVRDQLSAEHAL